LFSFFDGSDAAKSYVKTIVMKYILQCSALSKSFRSNTMLGASASILKNIDCGIAPLSVTGITGGSGCGKTTLSRCILNLIKLDSGIVLIHGSRICPLWINNPSNNLLLFA